MPDLFDSSDDFQTWFSGPLAALRGGGGRGRKGAEGEGEEGEEQRGDVAALSQEEYLLVTSRLHQVGRGVGFKYCGAGGP